MPCVREQAKDCMCACVRTFVTCWEVLRAVDQTLLQLVALHLLNFFVRLFVNLLLRKPEIESLGFTGIGMVNRFLSGGLLGQARLARTSGSQIRSRQQNERLERSTKSFGIPSFLMVVA